MAIGDPIIIKSGTIEFTRLFREYLTNNQVTASVVVGWKERPKQSNQGPGSANRIVIIPSDDSGKGGKLGPIRGPGPRDVRDADDNFLGTVRGLCSWDQQYTVSVWAQDPTDSTNEELQIAATEELFQWAIRATVCTGLAGDITLGGDTSWTVSPEKQVGRELRFTFTLKQPIYDVPMEAGFARPIINKVFDDGEEG